MRALVADDHGLFRYGLRRMLEESGIEVIGEAADGREAVRLTAELRPDVVVMDLGMPGIDGVHATRAIVAAQSGARVIVLTGSEDVDVLDALLAGACGYMLKGAGLEPIAAGVKAAARGQCSLAPEVAGRLVERLRALEAAKSAEHTATPMPELTAREAEVLRLLMAGCDNQEIARSLFISPSTVKHHVTAILSKLGVQNRVQAAVEAVRIGVLAA